MKHIRKIFRIFQLGFKNERSIYRAEKLKKEFDEIHDLKKSEYVFDMLLNSTSEKITIEITINKADSCTIPCPEFRINGREAQTLYNGSFIECMRRAWESYLINK